MEENLYITKQQIGTHTHTSERKKTAVCPPIPPSPNDDNVDVVDDGTSDADDR